MDNTCHLYTDLAWLWPMWGDAADEYAHYCRHVASLIEQHAERPAGTVLDIGCGGGKNVFNLKGQFSVTGVDLRPTMLAQARDLNPESTFVHGDMRTFRLGRTFDAVLMDDAISHMTCLADFVAAFRTASAHLNPGGVLVATPDVTTETFRQNKTTATPATRTGTRDELDVVFVENVYDPDPADEQYETTILYLIRDHGHLRIETDYWTMGLFSLDTWRRVLRETGFEVHEGRYNAGEDEYTVFACVKTGAEGTLFAAPSVPSSCGKSVVKGSSPSLPPCASWLRVRAGLLRIRPLPHASKAQGGLVAAQIPAVAGLRTYPRTQVRTHAFTPPRWPLPHGLRSDDLTVSPLSGILLPTWTSTRNSVGI